MRWVRVFIRPIAVEERLEVSGWLEGNVSDGYVLPLCQLRRLLFVPAWSFWQIMRVARWASLSPPLSRSPASFGILLVFVGGARAIIPFLCWQNLAPLARRSLFLSAVAAAAALLFFVSARYARTSRPAGCFRGPAKRSSFSRFNSRRRRRVRNSIQFNPIQSDPRNFN